MWFHFFLCLLNLIVFRGRLSIFKLICGNCIILRINFLRFNVCLLLSFILLLDFLGLLLGIRRFFLCCFLAFLLFLNLISNIFIIEAIGNNIKITLCLFIRRHLFLCYQIFTIVHNTGTFKLFDFIRIVSTFLLSWLSLLQLLFVLSNLLLVLSYFLIFILF